MPTLPANEGGNLVLQGLDTASRIRLEPHLQHVSLTAGEILEEKGHRASYLYFPITAGISLEEGTGKECVQVVLVGRKDMAGTSLLLDGVPATRAVVMFDGLAWRVPADALADCLMQSRELHWQLLRALNAFIANMSRTVRATARGTIEQRLAYWLLTAAEGLDTDVLAISHEMLSQVLGVRRSGVTVALHQLKGKKVLRTGHRRVRILDRQRLIVASGPLWPQTP